MPDVRFVTPVNRSETRSSARPEMMRPGGEIPRVVVRVGLKGKDGKDGENGRDGRDALGGFDDPGDLTLLFDNQLI